MKIMLVLLFICKISSSIVYSYVHFFDKPISELSLNCSSHKEVHISHGFPGTKRILYMKGITPIEYLSLNRDNSLVVVKEFVIPPLENAGANLSIAPATEEIDGYYLIFNGMKICGHGPLRNISACSSNIVYRRDAIWYIKHGPKGFNIHRGNMCITRITDTLGYEATESWPTLLRKCTMGNPDQLFTFDHLDNFYR